MAVDVLTIDVLDPPRSPHLRPGVDRALLVFTGPDGPVGTRWVSSATLEDAVVQRPRAEAPAVPAPTPDVPVTVVVCTRERPDDLARCLGALQRCVMDGDEILVVDNAPATSRTAGVVSTFPARRIVEPRAGLDRARNAGIAAARNDLVAFVDDDVVVTPFWRRALTGPFSEPEVVCVTGPVLPIELETRAQEEFERYAGHRWRYQPRRYSSVNLRPSSADAVGIGANMVFRRDWLRRLGGFDVRLDAGTLTRSGGDTDMFARVIDAGGVIAHAPGALVWHRHRTRYSELLACAFGYGCGTFAMLTRRLFEARDGAAALAAARWYAGTAMKAVRMRLSGAPAPGWGVQLVEWCGAAWGPLCFLRETWRTRDERRADRTTVRAAEATQVEERR